MEKAKKAGVGQEFPLLHSGIFNKNTEDLIKASKYSSVYSDLIKDLLKIEVAERGVESHLFLLNIFSDLENSTRNAVLINEDPLKGMVIYTRYMKTLSNIQKTLVEINKKQK